ncbi:MAG TPA: hypothetical protein VFI95_13370, partial [Terriglobales bacterium]|nr:hypothetical protein [Terriglobales bacterium]
MQRNSGSNSENQANQPHHIVRNLWFIVFACALCCCFSIRSAWAQSSTAATVLGTVTDNSGAVLRNA